MIDSLLLVGATKLALSVLLAALALSVQRSIRRPFLSHALWALVLLVLIVPSLVTIPLPFLGPTESAAVVPVSGAVPAFAGPDYVHATKVGLVVLWLLGAGLAVAWSLFRTVRFHRLLTHASERAAPQIQQLAGRIARQIGLHAVPEVHATRAHISPMVWWAGGPVRVLIPSELLDGLGRSELRWVLAHELAHVRRRDHVARWLEWLACVVFWWNPVSWWARRELRAAEEFCCDALVLAALRPSPRSYGGALLTVIDYLSDPAALRAPAFASSADSGGRITLIERRLEMIMGKTILTTPRWLRLTAGAAAVVLLPLGLIYCGPEQAVAPEDILSDAPGPTSAQAPIEEVKASIAEAERDIKDRLEDGSLSPREAEQRLVELRARAEGEYQLREVRVGADGPFRELGAGIAGQVVRRPALSGELQAESDRIREALQSGAINKEQAAQALLELELRIVEANGLAETPQRSLMRAPEAGTTRQRVGGGQPELKQAAEKLRAYELSVKERQLVPVGIEEVRAGAAGRYTIEKARKEAGSGG